MTYVGPLSILLQVVNHHTLVFLGTNVCKIHTEMCICIVFLSLKCLEFVNNKAN